MATQQSSLTLQLQPTRRKILLALKKSGGMTAGELSELLGMTAMGIRRHLTTMERDGLVMFELAAARLWPALLPLRADAAS